MELPDLSNNPALWLGLRQTEAIRESLNMTLNGKPIDSGKRYKVASWAPVAEGVSGEPVWDVVMTYLRDEKVVRPPLLNRPALAGVAGNPGIAEQAVGSIPS